MSATSMSTPMPLQNVFSKLSALSKPAPIDFRNATYWAIRSLSFIPGLPNRNRPLDEDSQGPLWRKPESYRLSGVRDGRQSLSWIDLPPAARWRRRAAASAAHIAAETHPELANDH